MYRKLKKIKRQLLEGVSPKLRQKYDTAKTGVKLLWFWD